MNADQKTSQDDAALLDLLQKAATRELPAPTVPEHLLWAYAFGKLDAEDDHKVLAIIARSQEARARLAKIRQAMELTAARLGAGSLPPDFIPIRLSTALKRAGKSIAACFVRAQASLETSVQEVYWGLVGQLSPGTLVLDDSGEAPPNPQQQEIVNQEGTRIIVSSVPGAGVSILVRVPPGVPAGIVELRRLAVQGESVSAELWDSRSLEDGSCEFPDCPPGPLEIITPDAKSVVLYVGDRPNAALNEGA